MSSDDEEFGFDLDFFNDFFGTDEVNDVAGLADELAYYSIPSPVWEMYEQNPGTIATRDDYSDWEYYSDDYFDEKEIERNNLQLNTSGEEKIKEGVPNPHGLTEHKEREEEHDSTDSGDTQETEYDGKSLQDSVKLSTKRRIVVVGHSPEAKKRRHSDTVEKTSPDITGSKTKAQSHRLKVPLVNAEAVIVDVDEDRKLVGNGILYKIRHSKSSILRQKDMLKKENVQVKVITNSKGGG